ncbi:MAG: glycosyltransferase [Calditrichia bacterium]
MDRIKIAYVIDTIESPTAGTEKQLILLIKNLNKETFEPHLVCLRSSRWLEEKYDLSPLHILRIGSFFNPSSYYKIIAFSRYLKNNGFHIVQTQFRDSNLAGILAARLAGTGCIISSRRNQGYWFNGFEIALSKILNKMTTHILANAENTKLFTVKNEKVDAERISVIYNGLDLKEFYDSLNNGNISYREQYGITPAMSSIGIVANLREVKGIDVFIRAAEKVHKKIDDVRFLIAGEGPEEEKLQRLVNELNLNHIVHFAGQVNPVTPFLKSLNIGVLSSRSESMSNAVIEYMAAGLPVVCTDTGGIHEIVIEGENGLIVPVGDDSAMAEAILNLLQNKLLLETICQSNAERARNLFSLNSFIQKYELFYLNLLNKGT